MIRLLFVIPTLDRSGAEKQLALLATNLPRDRFDIQVVALTRSGPYAAMLDEADIPLTVLGKRLRFDPLTWWRLRRLVKRWQPQIIHSWLFAANSLTRLIGRTGARQIVSERCVDSWKSGWQLSLDRRLIPRTDLLLANSQAVADFYRQVGYPPERIDVIPNAVATPPPPAFTRAELCRELGVPEQTRLVMSVGRLAPQKRLPDLLWAMQVLRQATPDVRYIILGDGPQRDQLIQEATRVECREYVHFLGHRDDAASFLHYADVFWLGSDFEGQSNSLMEAMACGCPVVVSDIPANRELVTHGQTGYLVDVGDAAGFAQFTRRLLNEPELATQLGTAAAARMQSNHSLPAMVERHVNVYEKILGGT